MKDMSGKSLQPDVDYKGEQNSM